MQAIDTSALRYDRTAADTYEAADLNRVGAMCATIATAAEEEIAALAAMRTQYGTADSDHTLPDFTVPTVTAKTDFALTDTYTVEQMQKYLSNVQNIVAHFPPAEFQALPENMRFLLASFANAIEWDLRQCAENLKSRADQTEANIKNTAAAFAYSGEIFAGGIL